eukprot:scaffold5143_cov119-Isochrysis_galbana.AAC.15
MSSNPCLLAASWLSTPPCASLALSTSLEFGIGILKVRRPHSASTRRNCCVSRGWKALQPAPTAAPRSRRPPGPSLDVFPLPHARDARIGSRGTAGRLASPPMCES